MKNKLIELNLYYFKYISLFKFMFIIIYIINLTFLEYRLIFLITFVHKVIIDIDVLVGNNNNILDFNFIIFYMSYNVAVLVFLCTLFS